MFKSLGMAVEDMATAHLLRRRPWANPDRQENGASAKDRKQSPGRVCQGLLGFRARQTRPQEYSVVKDPPDNAPSQGRPKKTATASCKEKALTTN